MLLDAVDKQSNTPLHYAGMAGNRPMIVLLLFLMAKTRRAASVTYTNNEGYTPVDIAVVKSPLTILPILSFFCPK